MILLGVPKATVMMLVPAERHLENAVKDVVKRVHFEER
jgi:hypothetical protein